MAAENNMDKMAAKMVEIVEKKFVFANNINYWQTMLNISKAPEVTTAL